MVVELTPETSCIMYHLQHNIYIISLKPIHVLVPSLKSMREWFMFCVTERLCKTSCSVSMLRMKYIEMLRFSRRSCFKSRSAGLWCRVVLWQDTNVSKVRVASIFRVKWRRRQHGPLKRWYPTTTLHVPRCEYIHCVTDHTASTSICQANNV
jgi:hypothetical protein